MMELSKTDTDKLIRLLDTAADIIDKYVPPQNYRDTDKARQLRQIRNKLLHKQNGSNR